MRFLHLVLAASLPLAASAEDRYVCKPAPSGVGWVCSGGAQSGAAEQMPKDGASAQAPSAKQENPRDKNKGPSGATAPTPATTTPAAPLEKAAGTEEKQAAVAPSAPTVIGDPQNLDWVSRSQLPIDLQHTVPRYCGGAYIEPPFPFALGAKREDFPVEAQAGAAEYSVHDRGTLSGAVRVTQGNVSVLADEATYRESDQVVQVDGHVVLQEPGFLAVGEHGEYNVQTGAATVTQGRFVMHPDDLRGSAVTLVRDEFGNVRVEHGRFTRCEPGNDSWTLSSGTILIDDGANFGTAHNAVLRAGPVPVFYTPYIRFPVTNERLTGFLFPELAYNNTGGVDVALPYYLNLAPSYDATLTPRYIEHRGSGGELELRDLTSWGKTQLGGAFLSHDDLYNGEVSRDDFEREELPGRFNPADRWIASADHTGHFGGFTTFVDYTEVSDRDYLRDLGSDLSAASHVALDQRGEIRYANDGLLLRLWAAAFQNLDNDAADSYRRLPEVAAQYRGRLLGPFHWSLSTSAADFYRNNDALVGIDRINGRRLHVEPRLELPIDGDAGFFRLAGGYRYTRYDLADVPVGDEDEPDRKIWFGTADAGLDFERATRWFGGGATQTLEPRVYYLYQQKEDQSELPVFDSTDLTFTFDQLFRDNRFAGLDRIGDANQLSTGVTTRLIESSGMERMRASVGQIFYFRDRDVTVTGTPTDDANQSTSSFAGQVALHLTGVWSLTSDALWDPHDGQFRQIGARLQFVGPARGVFNVGYRSLGDEDGDLDQFETSLYGHVLRHFVSEPGSVVVDHVQSDSAVLVQVMLKGLAGIGGRIENLMENGIRGYRPEGQHR